MHSSPGAWRRRRRQCRLRRLYHVPSRCAELLFGHLAPRALPQPAIAAQGLSEQKSTMGALHLPSDVNVPKGLQGFKALGLHSMISPADVMHVS